jgi:hypothetical protein
MDMTTTGKVEGDEGGERPEQTSHRQVAPLTAPPAIPEDAKVIGYDAAKVTALFRQPVEPSLLAAMANAPPGAGAFVLLTETEDGLQADTEFEGGAAIRMFYRHGPDGELVVFNWDFRLDQVRSKSGEWVRANPALRGAELLANQIRALRQVGATRIITVGARNDDDDRNKEQVGYCVWPKLGFDAPIPDMIWDSIPNHLQEHVARNALRSPHARSVLALVAATEGEAWWEGNGVGLDECVFDLQAGSVSMRVLSAYLGVE